MSQKEPKVLECSYCPATIRPNPDTASSGWRKHGHTVLFWYACPDCAAKLAISDEAGDERPLREMMDKSLRFDLDRAGIERREAEAAELVELRAKVQRQEVMIRRLQAVLKGVVKEEP